MKRFTRRAVGSALAAICAMGLWSGAARAQAVEIEYWQYTFPQRVQAMDELIKRFEAANPGIKVKQVTVPYDDFRVKIAAAVPAGQGPDVVQLFYGWLQDYLKAKMLQPLPAEMFNAADIEKEFFPSVKQMKVGGQYYALPTSVRSLALFWNKKLVKEAGLDPEKPPQTLDELVAAAERATKRDASGNLLQAGITIDMLGQDHHWIREVLIRQMGGKPYSPDNRKVTYNDAAGIKAVAWYTDLVARHKVGEAGFMTDGVTAFRSNRAAFTIDGSFRLAALDNQKGLDYAVAELPAQDGKRFNFTSYWVNGITPKATGAKREAAAKFLKFITSPEAQELWLEKVGELPAAVAVANKPAIAGHAKYGPFVRGLANAEATFFVNESAQRKVFTDMVDAVLIKKQPVAEAVATAAAEEQKLIDGFFGN
ncbi:extracellular solute-binding protein [Chelatococcus sp. SYSU_G07232]|uniref:Extracellular solute-binding protein n=1 Tax=Chelatococcus albus TaxID=3047466 RepID=A0ABT7AKX7_9HYPH|nr:extracellular solute-binding protein [Chelatococcus sp. SYSU_G07232]MDJ1160033.1 extracellular solute-binding protein [Chelatococcus sp. SYSU_G07232]